MNADGSGVRRLTSSPAFDCWPSPSPSGSKVAFTSTRDGGIDIFTMKLDVGLEPSTGAETLLLADGPPDTWSVAY